MIYLSIFILLILVSLYYDILNGRQARSGINAKFWYYLIYLIIISLVGLRDNSIGADTINYFRDYNATPDLSSLNSSYIESSRYQPLWVWLVSTIKSIFKDFNALLFVQAIFVNAVFFRFFWKFTKFPFICITIYFISFFIEFNTEILRESIAVSFCLLAYEQYSKRRWITSFIIWIIAFNFHVSAVIALIFPFFSKLKYSKKNVIILAIIGCSLLAIFPLLSQYTNSIVLFLQSISPTMSDRFSLYNSTEIDESLNINYYLRLFVIDFFIPLILLIYLKTRSDGIYGFVFIYIILKILTAFSYAFYRFGNYEAPYYIVLIGEVIVSLVSSTRRQPGINILKYIFVIIISLYTFQNMQLLPDTYKDYRYERYYPYISILD